jgi:hypothetical protein
VCNGRQTCAFLHLPPLSDCLTSEVGGCTQMLQSIRGAISSGRLVYDSAAAATCLSNAAPPALCASGGTLGYGVPVCQQVFKGTVANGGTCYSQYMVLLGGGDQINECASGSCSATYQSCPGQCVANIATDGGCSTTDAGAACATGDFCNGSTCTAYGGVGAPCDGAGQRCAFLLACGPHDADGAFTCEAKKESGAACSTETECDDYLCLSGTCRPGHSGEPCAPWGKCDSGLACSRSGCVTPLAANAACTPDYDACGTGLVCETTGMDDAGLSTGICQTPQTPTAGQPCFNGVCASSAWCDTTLAQPMCRAPGTSGQACIGGTLGVCATGLVCDGDAKKCQAPSTAGGPCSPYWSNTCATGYGCGPAKTCEAKVAAGAACDGSGVCPLNYYCDGTCKPAKLPGTACSGIDGECIGGQCDTTRSKCNGDCIDPG